MTSIFEKLGPNYTVPTETSPQEALRAASQRTGVDPKVLLRNGWGGPLHKIIHDPQVRDIMVQHDAPVWYRTSHGEKVVLDLRLDTKWVDFLAYSWRYVNSISGVIPEVDPIAKFRHTVFFPENRRGVRFQYAGSGFSALGSSIYIRQLPSEPFKLSDLVANGTLPQGAADMLITLLQAKVPIVLSGQTGCGKTTFLGALTRELQLLSDPLNLLVVEKSHEIPLIRPAYRWEEDSDGRVDLAELAHAATQMGLEWLILGECTGPEAYYVVKAFTQGVPVLTTLHASSATAGLRQLAMLALEYIQETKLLPNLLRALSEQAVVSIHLDLKERPDGALWGQVSGIEEMISVSGDKPVVNPLWSWKTDKQTGFGSLEFNRGCIAQLAETTKVRFKAAGIEFPPPSLMGPTAVHNSANDNNKQRGFFARR